MHRGAALVLALVTGMAACGNDGTVVVVRGADQVRVMAPEDVARIRAAASTTLAPLVARPAGAAGVEDAQPAASDPRAPGPAAAANDTVPQNVDNRPPELKLFDAYGKFRSCIEDAGYAIQGDLADPKNPAYQDSKYVEVVRTCAARSDIVNILQEVQSTRASLTPDQVEQRNEAFKTLQKCLVVRGWTIETTTNEIGLIEPGVFQGPDGTLDERDIDQCLSETGILDAVEEGTGG